MRRFVFRLEAPLRLAVNREDKAKEYLGECLRYAEAEKIMLKNWENKRDRVRELRRIKRDINVDELLNFDRYFALLRQKIAEARERVAAAEEAVMDARLRLAQAVKERKILDNLKEKKELEHRYEEEQRAQAELDQIATNIYTALLQEEQE